MKFKETNKSYAVKYNTAEYPEKGEVYKNTDELGNIDYMYTSKDNMVWSFPEYIFLDLIEALKKNGLENEPLQSETLEIKQNTVSEEFALKLIALSANKEKYSDLK